MRQRKSPLTAELADKLRSLVLEEADKAGIPAVFITCHPHVVWNHGKTRDRVLAARLTVWRVLIQDMGVSRRLVAEVFGRDLRRLRRSTLGF